ncbi:MAG: hypothetical protein LQ340_002630, partial [Diploschistes diacapsis]
RLKAGNSSSPSFKGPPFPAFTSPKMTLFQGKKARSAQVHLSPTSQSRSLRMVSSTPTTRLISLA